MKNPLHVIKPPKFPETLKDMTLVSLLQPWLQVKAAMINICIMKRDQMICKRSFNPQKIMTRLCSSALRTVLASFSSLFLVLFFVSRCSCYLKKKKTYSTLPAQHPPADSCQLAGEHSAAFRTRYAWHQIRSKRILNIGPTFIKCPETQLQINVALYLLEVSICSLLHVILCIVLKTTFMQRI